MEYRLLGPLEVLDGSGHKLPLGGFRQQTVLGSLLLRAGQTVGLERLSQTSAWLPPKGENHGPLAARVSIRAGQECSCGPSASDRTAPPMASRLDPDGYACRSCVGAAEAVGDSASLVAPITDE
jgi:hypothetical protein